MSDFRRRTVIAKKPYDAEIEYLGSTGTQWIDTLLKAQATTKIELKFNLSNTRFQSIYGCIVNTNYGMFLGTSQGDSSLFCNRTNPGYVSPAVYLSSNTDYIIKQESTSLKINNTTCNVTAPQATTNTMILFARDNNGTIERMITGRIYYCRFYDGNNNLIEDFIPVRVGQVGYMYDKVSNKLFGNSGTGNFILGPDL